MNYYFHGENFEGTNGCGKRFIRAWIPMGTPKAAVQIVHGMAEYIERYDPFMQFLAKNGYAAFGISHAGHGTSVSSPDEYGQMGQENSMTLALEDQKKVSRIIANYWPGLPLILFGHSMGSFMVRGLIAEGDCSAAGAILMGTGGPNPAVGLGIKMAEAVKKKSGANAKSRMLDAACFGGFAKAIRPRRTDFDWLNRDAREVDKYIADPGCGFSFSAESYRGLFEINKAVNEKSWADKVKKEMPILLVSGESDPVGGMSKGVKKVFHFLQSAGCREVTMRLYEGARHELLLEQNRDEVMRDVLSWLDRNIGGTVK